MNQLCQFKLCYFYDPPLVTASDRNKIKQINCDYCDIVFYCSEKCKESDWSRQHANQCPGNPDRQVDDPQSPCFQGENPTSQDENPPLQNPPEDRTVDDFVVVTSQIGQGSYGNVDLVKDVYTGQLYAMKTVNKANPVNPYTLKREAAIQGKLQHKNVLQLFMCFEDRESLKLVLEYAENGSLSQITHHAPNDEMTVWQYFQQICLGINYLHSNNVIHRDLKPENILISGDVVKLSDFGWSTELERPSTKRDTICGTIDYMAPEIMYSDSGYSFKVDVWSLGVILYEMLEGQVPFKEKRGLEDYLSSPTKITLPNKSAEVNDLINQMLEVKPEKRIDLNGVVSHSWFVEMSKRTNFDLKGFFSDFISHTPKGDSKVPQFMIFSSEEEEKQKSERSSVISVGCIDDYFKQFSLDNRLNGLQAQLENYEKGILKSDQIDNRTSMRFTRMSRISKRLEEQAQKQPESRFQTIWNFFSCVTREKQQK